VSALSKHAYACSEAGDGKYRLVLGFNTRDELHDAHEEIARLAVKERNGRPAPQYASQHGDDCMCADCTKRYSK
jgi:hypothetical protein